MFSCPTPSCPKQCPSTKALASHMRCLHKDSQYDTKVLERLGLQTCQYCGGWWERVKQHWARDAKCGKKAAASHSSPRGTTTDRIPMQTRSPAGFPRRGRVVNQPIKLRGKGTAGASAAPRVFNLPCHTLLELLILCGEVQPPHPRTPC